MTTRSVWLPYGGTPLHPLSPWTTIWYAHLEIPLRALLKRITSTGMVSLFLKWIHLRLVSGSSKDLLIFTGGEVSLEIQAQLLRTKKLSARQVIQSVSTCSWPEVLQATEIGLYGRLQTLSGRIPEACWPLFSTSVLSMVLFIQGILSWLFIRAISLIRPMIFMLI